MNSEGIVLSKMGMKGQIPWDSVYTRFLETADSQRQKAEGWVLGAGAQEVSPPWVQSLGLGRRESSDRRTVVMLYNDVTVLKAAEP